MFNKRTSLDTSPVCAYDGDPAEGMMIYGPDDHDFLCGYHLVVASEMHAELTAAMNAVAPVRERG